MITISTKNLSLIKNSAIDCWINKGKITSKLIDWYFTDNKSRQWFIEYCEELKNEYTQYLSGDARIRWYHLNSLLYNPPHLDTVKEKFFHSFLYGNNGKRSIKKINFKIDNNTLVPESL
jgi:hypothetical protein